MLSLIVATDKNGMIAKDGKIPWQCKEDLKHFKSMTMGCPIIMGRKTFESLPKVLPGRDHYVVTRNSDRSDSENIFYFDCWQKAYWSAVYRSEKNENIFIIGGAQIYDDVMTSVFYPERIFISIIDTEIVPNETSLYFKMSEKNHFLAKEEQREGFTLQEWHGIDRSQQ